MSNTDSIFQEEFDDPLANLDNGSWPSARLKHVAKINPDTLSGNVKDDWHIEYVDISSVNKRGEIMNTENYTFEDAPSRARRCVQHGDTIVSTVRTYLKAIAFVEDPPENLIVSTGFAVVRPGNDLYPRFMWWSLQASPFVAWIVANSKGVSYPAISASKLGELNIPLPNLEKQKKIVSFLDIHTSDIDELIDEKQYLLELLEEKRKVIIEQEFTPGLEPDDNFGMVDWSTNLPNEWEMSRGRWLFNEVDERSEDGTEMLFSLRLDQGLIPHADVSDKEFDAEDLVDYKKVYPGQLVMNRMRAATGLIGVAPSEGLVSPDYAIFEAKEEVYPQFYEFLFRTEIFKTLFRSRSSGLGTGSSGFLRLYSHQFLSLWFPHPPLKQQKQIVENVESKLELIKDLSESTESSIQLLKQRRDALVTAAVTGQIDLSDWDIQEDQELPA